MHFMAAKITDARELYLKANAIRQSIIEMLVESKSGHTAGPMGLAEIFSVLYFNVLNLDPKKPFWDGRDRLLVSNGHVCPVQYAAMAHAGFFPLSELKTFRKLGSRLQGHPHNTSLPGIENSGGPLAQGLSQAVGRALAARLDGRNHRVYCVTSDGEHDEGQIWEAVLFAAKMKVDNLTVVMDRNNIQIDGNADDVMPLEPLVDKYKAFNWNVFDVNGHDIPVLLAAFKASAGVRGKPTMIIARTTPGKGVSFMENKFEWHGKPPNAEEGEKALAELRAAALKL